MPCKVDHQGSAANIILTCKAPLNYPMTTLSRPPIDLALLVPALLACSVPTLLAYHRPPSAIAINECLAVVLWGGVAAMSFSSSEAPHRVWAKTGPLIGALVLVFSAALCSWSFGTLPLSMALPAAGLLAAAVLLAMSGASASNGQKGLSSFTSLAFGLMIAGLASSAVGLLQVFAQGWADPDWISPTNVLGRATGNVRQPNQLASLLLWALVATVALYELRWLPRAALWAATALLVWVLALTASRAGALGLVLLVGWALVDNRLSRTARWLLSTTPLLYALAYIGMFWFNSAGQKSSTGIESSIGVALRIGNIDDRLNVWKNAIDLALTQPWTGVVFVVFGLCCILNSFV
jgi:O-antigen ligase